MSPATNPQKGKAVTEDELVVLASLACASYFSSDDDQEPLDILNDLIEYLRVPAPVLANCQPGSHEEDKAFEAMVVRLELLRLRDRLLRSRIA